MKNTERTKVCRRCREEKPIDEFYKNSSMKDGRDYYCSTCRRETSREYLDAQTQKCKNTNCLRTVYAKGLCRRCYSYQAVHDGALPDIRLNREIVKESAERIIGGSNITSEAQRLGVSPATIRNAIKGSNSRWAHIRDYIGEDTIAKVDEVIQDQRYTRGAKITRDQADEIRELYPDMTMREIAAEYNLSVSGVSLIVNYKRHRPKNGDGTEEEISDDILEKEEVQDAP